VGAGGLRQGSLDRAAGGRGAEADAKHRSALSQIESRFGVPASVVLAIWGRETDYGRYRLPYDTVRVVATQAYVGRRKDRTAPNSSWH